MVRLKGNDADVLNLFTEISIPYGAIKSGEFSADYAANNKISIPYGAIKSHKQVHLHLYTLPISIPYGAIKRM